MERLKVLISAYACSPYRGSEPGMGWGWVKALSEYHDLWVITETGETRADVEKELDTKPEIRKGIRFFYIARRHHRALAKVWPLSYYSFYKKWQKKAYRLARSLHEKIRFDLVHQLNMIGYREPGYLWKLDAPFVWGPVGGTANVPLRFASVMGVKESLYHLARNTINAYQLTHNRRVRTALARADGFVTATLGTRESFLRASGKDSVVISATGIKVNPNHFDRSGKYAPGRPLNLVYAGLHFSRKALPIALRALAILPPKCLWHLDILGKGPMTKSWRRLANKLGIEANCTWHGWLPKHDDVVDITSKADVFVFPSLQEGTPTVVLEALSRGLPVICFDRCGMGDVVNEDCGVKIPVTASKQAIYGFAEAIKRLTKNPDEVERLSLGAVKCARQYSWHTRVQEMLKVYPKAIEHWQKKRGCCVDVLEEI